jgi:hypothetical protein
MFRRSSRRRRCSSAGHHRIKLGDENDFSVRNLSQIAETAESSGRIMALLLTTVADAFESLQYFPNIRADL